MVLGAVALYNRQLPISEGGQKYRLFAKTGLPVRAGQESTLSVSGRVAVSWGNGRYPWTSTLTIPACSSEEGARWFAYPGGFTLDEPQCVTLVVKTGGQEQTVPVPVGTTCPYRDQLERVRVSPPPGSRPGTPIGRNGAHHLGRGPLPLRVHRGRSLDR